MLFSFGRQFYRSTLYIYIYIQPEIRCFFTYLFRFHTNSFMNLKNAIVRWNMYNLFLKQIKPIGSGGITDFWFYPTLLHSNRFIGLVGRVFANGPGDRGSIPRRVIPKILKMVLATSLLNTQQYKVRIKGLVEQSWERSCGLPYTSV